MLPSHFDKLTLVSFGMPCKIFGRIEWQQTLVDLKKVPDIAYQDVLNGYDSTGGGLHVTHSNLVVMWKVRPHTSINYKFPLICVGSPKVVVFWFHACN